MTTRHSSRSDTWTQPRWRDRARAATVAVGAYFWREVSMEVKQEARTAAGNIADAAGLHEKAKMIRQGRCDDQPMVQEITKVLTTAQAETAALRDERDIAVQAAVAVSRERDDLRAEVERLRSALDQAGQWFAEYAVGHTAKGADDKAQRNAERAQFCFSAALTEPQPVKPCNWRYDGTDYHGSHKGEDAYKCEHCGSRGYFDERPCPLTEPQT